MDGSIFDQLVQVAKEVGITHVYCHVCGQSHPLTSNSYFWVLGNIHAGPYGGLVGNNLSLDLNADGNVVLIRGSIYCKGYSYEESCLRKALIFAYETPDTPPVERWMNL